MNEVLDILWTVFLGLTMSSVVSFYAYHKKSLDRSGTVAAIVLGTTIFVCGGWYFLAVLLTFFISSSLLSRLHKGKEDSLRTYKQVLANGSVAMVLSILYAIFQEEIFVLLYTISFAVSTADTWSSEIGTLSKRPPIHLLTQMPMKTGISGAVSYLGLLAGTLGALLIGLLSLFVLPESIPWYNYLIPVTVFGYMGTILDSFLGTIQGKYYTKDGDMWDDVPPSGIYESVIGYSFITNNMVNFVSNLLIVLMAFYILR